MVFLWFLWIPMVSDGGPVVSLMFPLVPVVSFGPCGFLWFPLVSDGAPVVSLGSSGFL